MIRACAFGLALAAGTAFAEGPRLTLETEAGAAWIGRNDAAFPGDTGTRFSLTPLTGQGAFPALRTTLTWEAENGPGWRLLVAPFRASGTGRLGSGVSFDGQNFAAGTDTRSWYRFDSYRLTWRNRFHRSEGRDWRIGATLKVRDAEIALRQGGTFGQTRNTGLVPLLHIFGEEDLPGPWALSFDLDAAAAPQGRAIDAAARIHYTVQPGSDLFLSLRILDGGADNDEVYSFATVTSVALGWRVRF